MFTKEDVELCTKDLAPNDVLRAIKFNQISKEEAIITYKMFLEQNKLPRKIFIEGYNAMYAMSALFLAKKYNLKLDESQGRTHKNMREILNFYTQDDENHNTLIKLYDEAMHEFEFLTQKYKNEEHFANKIVKHLIDEGYYQGKKVTYYSDEDKKDPLSLTIDDAKKFINEIVEVFLFIMEKLTNDR
jgi:hypothetical protein